MDEQILKCLYDIKIAIAEIDFFLKGNKKYLMSTLPTFF